MRKDEFYRDARHDLTGPLEGVRVVEATTTWAGPMCGALLADLGADVIKVELPEGEMARRAPPFLPGHEPPLSFMQATVNRNKRSLCLDLRQPDGAALFRRLAARSDVVIENFRPGGMERFGLGYEQLRAERPELIYVSISGFGHFGPDADQVGYDPLAQAASGFLSLNGDPDGGPVKSPTFLADDLAGLHGALAALAALRHRDRTGEGQRVDVSLLDAVLAHSNGYLTLGALGIDLPRLGNEFRIAAPARVYRCRDGEVMTGVLLDAHWRRLCALWQTPERADDPRYATTPARLERRAEVDTMLAEWLASRSRADALESLRQAGVPAAPVRTYAEAAADPHVRERDMLQRVPQSDGVTAPITGPAAKLSRTPQRVRSPAPALGAHTEAILGELGLSADELTRLRERGVI